MQARTNPKPFLILLSLVLSTTLAGSISASTQDRARPVTTAKDKNLMGTLIVLNKAEASASLLDLATGEEFLKLETGTGPHEVAVSPDGKIAVVANYGGQTPGNSLTVIDLTEKKVIRTIDLAPNGRPHGIEFLADGRRVVVTCEQSQTLIVVDIEESKILQTIKTDAQISHMVAVMPNGERAFVANIGSGSMTVIDLQKNVVLKEIKTNGGAEGIAISPDGAEVWVTNRSGDTVSIIDAQSLEILAELECPSFPIRVKFTPDGKMALVSNARSGDVAVFDVQKREIKQRIPMNEVAADDAEKRLFSDQFGTSPVPVGILISPDGGLAFIANTNADIITVIDLNTLKIVNRLRAGDEPDGLGWSPLVLK